MITAIRLGKQKDPDERHFAFWNDTTDSFLRISESYIWSTWEELLEDLIDDNASQACIDRMWDLCPVFAKKHLMVKSKSIHDVGGEG